MTSALEFFQMEAAERTESISSCLVAVESATDADAVEELVTTLFREAHSLKGAAGVVGLDEVSRVCHRMEDVLGAVRDGNFALDSCAVDTLLRATDTVQEMIAAEVEHRERPDSVEAVVRALEALRDAPATPSAEQPAAEPTPTPDAAPQPEPVATTTVRATPTPATRSAPETIRIAAPARDSIVERAGELRASSDRLRDHAGHVRRLARRISELGRRASASPQRDLDAIARAVADFADEFENSFAEIAPAAVEVHDALLDLQMISLDTLFDQMPRLVRDISREFDRRTELIVEGGETRVDRQVLDQLRDALIHLVRNAIYHGIETTEERLAAGKPEHATLTLRSVRVGDHIQISVEDDGRGIDHERIRQKAIERGLLGEPEAAAASETQLESLILQPGFSTAAEVNDVAGRGVGLDVVRSRIEDLGGRMSIATERGRFTRFVLELPASTSTLDGLLVRAAGHVFVVPTVSVVATVQFRRDHLHVGPGGEATVHFRDEYIPIVGFAEAMNLRPGEEARSAVIWAFVCRTQNGFTAFAVERVVGAQTLIVKPVDRDFVSAACVIGATVLDSGAPAIIVDPVHLVASGVPRFSPVVDAGHADPAGGGSARILVVDDSITTRMMEKSILEAAGFDVEAAVSAENALEILAGDAEFDLILSDVEMPGRNGFELTAQLRADERWSETPIVIVSSLSKDEHRRRAEQAGANAYIVKGEFEQGVFLNTIKDLVGS